MNQPYFIVVFAHSLHGRLRRVHIPHQAIYIVFAFALLGVCSLFGFVSSYLRMTWKVANYNALRSEFDVLRTRYQKLQREANQTHQQLATFQNLASEITVAYGLKAKLEGPDSIASEGRLVPTIKETLEEYNFLKSANLANSYHQQARLWQTEITPSLWPVSGPLMSYFGRRGDPFSGEDAFHAGVDISVPSGTTVRASADGIVVHAEWNSGYGKLVVVDHGNGLQTYYAHLSRFEVVNGQEIRRGDLVGESGATGRATAPHLHYEVRVNGTPVNPYPYLGKTTLASAGAKKDFSF